MSVDIREKDNDINIDNIDYRFQKALLSLKEAALKEITYIKRIFITETKKNYKIQYRATDPVPVYFIYTYATIDKETGAIYLKSSKKSHNNILDF